VCSNKDRRSADAELARLGWSPDVAYFAGDFDGRPKRLEPVLDALDVSPDDVVYVGDTEHDLDCADAVGAAFAWAGWNPRTAATSPGGIVAHRPADVLGLLEQGRI
jgi:phosphoglycolate phosphatase-like HAD superfamily hydrolase